MHQEIAPVHTWPMVRLADHNVEVRIKARCCYICLETLWVRVTEDELCTINALMTLARQEASC